MTKEKVSWLAVPVCALSIAVSGCAKSADTSPRALSKALLEITDMPGDWQETQRDVFEARGNENPSLDPSIWCPDAADEAAGLIDLAGDSGADVEMQMESDGEEVPRLMRLQAWRNEDVRRYFEQIVTVLNMCDGAKWTEEPGVTTEMWKIDGPEVGDESVSWGSQLAPPEGKEAAASMGRTTVARLGEVIMVLQIGDFTTTSSVGELTDADWREIVQRAADKLADA